MPQHATVTSFKPGQVGNPGGRPRAAVTMTAEARRYAIEAIQALVRTMRTETGASRIAAARELLDRGFGKPAQNVDFTLSKKINEMSLEELSALEQQMTGLVIPALSDQREPDMFARFDDEALGARIEIDPEPQEVGR
jgi:hypothetical protein